MGNKAGSASRRCIPAATSVVVMAATTFGAGWPPTTPAPAAQAAPALLAAPALQVSPVEAAPSAPVTATGQGFDARGTVTLHLGAAGSGPVLATVPSTDGGFTASFAAPDMPGRYSVGACAGDVVGGTCRSQASARLVVVAPPPPTRPPPEVTTTTSPRIIVPTTTTTTRPGGLTTPTTTTTGGGSTTTTTDTRPDGSDDTTPDGSRTTGTGTGTGSGSGTEPAAGAGLRLDRPSAGPGEVAAVEGWGCDTRAVVRVAVAGLPTSRVRARRDGTFHARLTVPDLDVGPHRVTARCPRTLDTELAVVLASSSRPASATLAVLVFFVLLLLGTARRFLGLDRSRRT